MPNYDYKCPNCKIKVELFRKISDTSEVICDECKSEMELDYSSPTQPPDFGFKAFWSENLTPNPGKVYVSSREAKKKLMKQHGLEEAG